ncbi:MAG: zf-HC2 domain-containing protein, partial [Janibacter sp.]
MSDDLHSLSGAYVLDALTDVERAHFEAHLDRCPTCRDEVDSLREVAPLLSETVATPPPPSLRADILTRARETRQDPPEVAHEDLDPATETTGTTAPVIPLRRRSGWVALAAAAALVVGGGVTWQVVDEATTSMSEEVAGADDARTWQAETADGGTVVVTRSEDEGRA